MATNRCPVAKKCKRYGISPAVMGYAKKNTNRNNGGTRRKKVSEYGIQLNEKQKVKFIYGIQEKQFHHIFDIAKEQKGPTGENMMVLIERRLDNIIYRLGLCSTRHQARQMVAHGHFTVNGKKVDIPSARLYTGDVVAVCEKSSNIGVFKYVKENSSYQQLIPNWLTLDAAKLSGTVIQLPTRENIDFELQETLIVELYSK